ncbi:unnamed protein product [Durusdinium trenchii]|uniref:Uncharacterized protein n=1 Tax=Durusdinium trenchii TaxID=1381693 RepID=A0ABP0N6L2_9DINO
MRKLLTLGLCCLLAASWWEHSPAMALRRVLVTGGNKGIGRALCQQLAADHGFYVFLGSRDAQRGKEAVESILLKSPECQDRLQFLPLDVASDTSVAKAAEMLREQYGAEALYGIVNNAGVGFQTSMAETLNINTYGPKRVCDHFLPLIDPQEGRIVNTASASGPNYNSAAASAERAMLTSPDVTWEELDACMQKAIQEPAGRQPYGFSKACLIAYTMILAREHPTLKINAMTPGYILTDITRGMGASKPPEEGTKAAIYCLTGELKGNGWYYGSDALRSPIDRYRAPGDPPYEGP